MLKNLRDLSMGAKLALIVMPVMAALCAGMYLSFLPKIASTERQAASERVRMISDIIAREVGFALRGDDLREIGRAIDSIGRQHNLNYLLVNSDPGTIMGAFREDEARSSDFLASGPQNELDVEVYKISLPIARKKRPNVLCYAGIGLQDLHAASDRIRSSLETMALILFFGGTLLALGAILLVTHPLVKVLKIAEEGTKGNIQGRIPARSKDEAGRLVTALNTLFLNMETTSKRIENLAGMLNNRDHELAQEMDRRKLSEKQIQLSNQIITNASALILVTNPSGGIDYASPSFYHVLGYKPEDLLQDGWWKVTMADAVERKKERNLTAKSACGEHPIKQVPYERQVADARGNLRWILWQDTVGLNRSL